ncbi:MAG: uroporphyrinogen-III synthase [Proteobacteria bacterium]|jgi:uroporphyrinogen-III synthase|nr:uroporphyrinogen-III synthase [Pseudomonadota bacterium]MDA1299758.1 uroporphyrinogen-III synthase [Pseudomonadota bacterium]
MADGLVVLTRPNGDNDSLSERLRADGHSVLIRPLLEIRPLPLEPAGRQCAMALDRFDAVIFVSRNAVRYGIAVLEQFWPQWPLSTDWYGVGKQTALELSRHGIDARYPESSGSEGLIRMVDWQQTKRVLIIRGRGGLALLQEYLEDQGVEVSYLEVYERAPRCWPELGDEITPGSVIVLASGEAVAALRGSIPAGSGKGMTNHSARLDGVTLIVPSGRVRSIAEEHQFERIVVANDAGDEGTLEALARMAGDHG